MLQCMEGLDEILRIYNRRLQGTPEGFKRYLIDKIDWRDNLIAIKGAKGTGKTTMLLQHIKESFTDKDKALYLSLDNLWFETHSINDLIEYHYTHGGTHLFLDEVHYFPNWKKLSRASRRLYRFLDAQNRQWRGRPVKEAVALYTSRDVFPGISALRGTC